MELGELAQRADDLKIFLHFLSLNWFKLTKNSPTKISELGKLLDDLGLLSAAHFDQVLSVLDLL